MVERQRAKGLVVGGPPIRTIPLTKSKGEYSIQDEYYLGEDEKGIYLSPGFHCEFIGPEITLKFRKVTE